MNRPVRPGDPIEQYLAELRRGLRSTPGEAEAILAEAEDHLRETAAAGAAIGMTEREAQEAAISSFGPVRAVTRAHLARLTRRPAVLAMAAWKLVSLLSLTVGASSMAAIVVSGFGIAAARSRVVFAANASGMLSDHLSFNLVNGVWTDTAHWNGRSSASLIAWYWSQSAVGWRTAVLLAAAGAVLLAGYGVARRRWPGTPLPRFFPALAVSVFGAIGLAFLVLELGTNVGIYDPRPLIAVCLALALGYVVRLGQARLRQR
jgi:hypothetical protein